jgi:hypothetical protein
MFDQQRADTEPWRQTGQSALDWLSVLTGMKNGYDGRSNNISALAANAARKGLNGGFNLPPSSYFGLLSRQFGMDDFESDPGYQFRLAEGEKTINRAAAARGGYDSGGTLRALSRYGQNVASDEYQNAFNRWNAQNNQLYNRFASLAGVGQVANNQLGQAGQNYANQVGNIAQNNAANQGNALLAGANARASGYTGFGNALASGLNAWSMNQQQPQSPWLASGNYWGSSPYGGTPTEPWYG